MHTIHDFGGRGLLLPILFIGSFVLSFPAAASTPPLPPLLSITSPDVSTPPGSDLVIWVRWEKDGSYWSTPDHVSVTLYAIPEGTAGATWTLERLESPGKPGDKNTDYSLTVPNAELPAGEFIMIADDPVSGAIARKYVVLHGPQTSQADIPVTSLSKDPMHMPKMNLPFSS